MGVIPWHWHGEGSIEGEVDVEQLLSNDPDEFAGGYAYEETEPLETQTFSARGLTWSEVETLRTQAKTRLHVWAVSTEEGSWSGLRRSLSWKRIEGTLRWEVTLVLITLPTEPS